MASAAQAKEFIQRIAPIIQEEAKKRGYKSLNAFVVEAIKEKLDM